MAEDVERRLAAILAADVAGYSRLMGADEVGTLAAVKAHHEELIEPAIARRRGRIVKLMGDGLLAEFASVIDAVACAAEVQRALAERNYATPPDGQVLWRMGINLGDVIVDGEDIFGDGVNLAARLEGLAEPGGLCISGDVQRQIDGKLDHAFEDLGEQSLKNIDRPVSVFALRPSRPKGADEPPPKGLTEKPGVAVLPFTNMSGDPEQEYFSDGITEDIITELSRFRELLVIARNSSFAYKGEAVKVQDIARDLGVAYLVEGSVRKAGSRVRVTAQLIEAATGNHLWAERYDRELADVFAVQDEITRTIAGTVSGRLDLIGQQRALRLSGESLQAYDLVLKGKALVLLYTKENNARARELLEQAVALDPDNTQALTWLAETYLVEANERWVADYRASFDRALELATQAVRSDETDTTALAMLGEWHMHVQDYGQAEFLLKKALELNPNNFHVRCSFGVFLDSTGESEQALEEFNHAKTLNPIDQSWVPLYRGIANFSARRYEAAIAEFKQPRDPIDELFGWLAASYALNGQTDEAREALEEYLHRAERNMAVFPGRRLEDWRDYWQWIAAYKDPADLEHLLDGLRKAGLED
jgi:adenylate cyclase